MFTGQNLLPGFPSDLEKVVSFLKEKVALGEFEFSDSLEYWAENEDVIRPLGLSFSRDGYYYAVSLAHLSQKGNGKIEFPNGINIWRWAWAVNILASVAGWPPQLMINVMNSFEGREKQIDVLMDRAAQSYARMDYDKGNELLAEKPRYRVSVLAGLIENDFERYCREYHPVENPEEFASAFVMANSIRDEVVTIAFDLALQFPDFTSTAAMTMFLTVHDSLDEGRMKLCEQRIRELLSAGNTMWYVEPVSNWVFRRDNITDFGKECILSLVSGLGEENSEHLKTIDHAIAFNQDDHDFLVKVCVCVAENLLPLDVLKMENSLHKLNENRDNFLNFVLSFILHPKGMYRMAGRKLWDQYHLESLDFNPLELEEPLQCIFIISMLQDFGNPETRLPKVLPLLKSDSEKVRGLLMKCIHPYIDDYMGHVINALDKLLLDCKEEKTIRKYFKIRSETIQMRREMKELSPAYTHGNELREALRMEKQHRQQQVKEAESEHKSSWMGLLASVALARGGGWRKKDGTTQHLGVISFSMPARQLTQSMSPKELDEWLNQLMKDWDDTAGNH